MLEAQFCQHLPSCIGNVLSAFAGQLALGMSWVCTDCGLNFYARTLTQMRLLSPSFWCTRRCSVVP